MKHVFIALLWCWTVTIQPAGILKVPDGDTFHAEFLTWDDQKKLEKFRLNGVDSPENRIVSQVAHRAAQAFTSGWLRRAPFQVTYCGDRDKYGRAVATPIRGTDDLVTELLRAGHGVPSSGRR